MKKKVVIAISAVLILAFLTCSCIFFSSDVDKLNPIYDEIIQSLDTKQGLKELFLQETLDNAKNLDEKIEDAYNFFQGNSIEVKDYKIYRESNKIYRAYAIVKTDKSEYFVCAGISGARKVDTIGVKQIIIDDTGKYLNKKFFKFEKFQKYMSKTKEYGITIVTDKEK